MRANLKTKSIKGVLWSASEGFGVAALSFVTFMVMARALDPRDFGVVAMAGVFVFFSNLVAGHGFADAIVQRLKLDPEHLDTAFWSTLGLSLALMGLCQAAAEPAAALLGEPALAEVLRWLSLSLPIGAAASVPTAVFRSDMLFAHVAICTVSGRLAGAAVGVAMALTGWGMWSLVGQQIAGTVISAAAVALLARWRPRLHFSVRHLREMWAFGFHVSASQVVAGAGEQLLNLLIGALFGSTALGYFAVAWRMVQLIRSLVSSAVYYVGLSAFAKLQDDRPAVTRAYVQSTRMSCLAGFPIGIGLALLAGPVIAVLFGAKWQASAGLLSVLALDIITAFCCIFNSALYRAMGKPEWSLWLALSWVAAGITGVVLLAPFGMPAIVMFWVVRGVALVPLNVWLARRLLGAPLRHLLDPMRIPAIASAVMALGLVAGRTLLEQHGFGPVVQLGLLVPLAMLLYLGVVRILSPELAELATRTARVMLMPARGSQ
ncbi:MAG: lipopolysaccharide biosynthesis protein [Alphaproteobacteria bacterium]|nr:lipopolysaccharide biosynthesis protein [Alphaproteobacteria bacterium]